MTIRLCAPRLPFPGSEPLLPLHLATTKRRNYDKPSSHMRAIFTILLSLFIIAQLTRRVTADDRVGPNDTLENFLAPIVAPTNLACIAHKS